MARIHCMGFYGRGFHVPEKRQIVHTLQITGQTIKFKGGEICWRSTTKAVK